jgi:hypothetical protein
LPDRDSQAQRIAAAAHGLEKTTYLVHLSSNLADNIECLKTTVNPPCCESINTENRLQLMTIPVTCEPSISLKSTGRRSAFARPNNTPSHSFGSDFGWSVFADAFGFTGAAADAGFGAVCTKTAGGFGALLMIAAGFVSGGLSAFRKSVVMDQLLKVDRHPFAGVPMR